MTTHLDGTTARAWISTFCDTFQESQQQLTNLDRLAGDGDFGTNIASALRRVDDALPSPAVATFTTVFAATSKGFLATGGTSGPLFGMWFRMISKAADDAASVPELASGIQEGLATIQKLGGAKVGDNTMIDALAPASAALTGAAENGADLVTALTAAAEAARVGAESTGALVAARGRASYVGKLALGVLDPGAVTIALLFEAGATAAGSQQDWPSLLSVPAHS